MHKHPVLGRWVPSQRLEFKKENHGQLTEKRIKLLDDLGFIWDTKKVDQAKWEESHQKLKTFNGKYSELIRKDPPLARWIRKQRKLRKSGDLSENRIRLLNEINFIWNIPKNGVY